MQQGYIKLHRKIKEWALYDDEKCLKLFIHLLLSATHKEMKYKGVILKAGQTMTSIRQLMVETNLTEWQVRNCLKKLKNQNAILVKPSHKKSLITIANWELYQIEQENSSGNPSGNPSGYPTQKHRDTPHKNLTLIEQECEEIKNEKKNNPPIVPPKGGKAEGGKTGTAKATSKPIASWEEIETLLVGFDDEFKDCYRDYMIMRKSIKKPLTMRAAKIGLGKLKRFSKGDAKVAIQIMEQSILNSWQDFYELERKGARKQTEEVNFTDFL